MTFKIDKVGFYKNRKGERVEIIARASSGQWWRHSDGKGYHADGRIIDRDYEHEDIIAHWKEPLELKEFEAIDESAPISKGQIGDFWEKVCEERTRNSNHISNKPKNKFYAVTSNASNTGILFTYDTLEQAQKGAKSLALNEPDIKFYILETIGAYTAEVEIKEIKI